MSVAWNREVSRHWSVLATGGATRLLGRYGDSPIVQIAGSRDQYSGSFGISRSFSLGL